MISSPPSPVGPLQLPPASDPLDPTSESCLCGSSGSGRFGSVRGVGFLFFIIFFAIRHLRGFWFSRKLRGHQSQAGALADGGPGVDGLWTVGGQHPAVLPDAARDGQTGLVPHGFCEGELRTNRRKSRQNL